MERAQSNRTAMHSGSGKVWRWLAALAATFVAAVIVFAKPSAPAKPRLTHAGCRVPVQQVGLRQVRSPRLQAGQLPAHPPDPPGTIDGAKNPELIPDDLAYKMLFLSLAEPENPTDVQKARQNAKVGMLKLSPGDNAALLGVVSDFQKQMKELDAQVADIVKVTPAPPAGSSDALLLDDIQQQKEKLLTDTIASLAPSLTLDGAAMLQTKLVDVKRGIKRIPWPSMTGYQ